MKQVYTTTRIADAEMIRVILRKYGVQSMLDGASVGIHGPATPMIITVQDADSKRAFEIIRESRSPRKPAPKKQNRTSTGRTTRKKSPRKKARKTSSGIPKRR